MQLFRTEALNQKSDRLTGSVSIAVPVSWQVIAYLIFGGLAAALIFLSLANYSRVETVSGAIVPDKGVVAMVPTRSGIIVALNVRDGQQVREGTILASIRAEEDAATGGSSAARIEEAIARQNASLSSQISAIGEAALAQQQELSAQRAGLSSEIIQIGSQISLQHDLVESAQRDLDRARTVAARGFISGRDIQQREDAVLARKQQLAQLEQNIASKRAELRQAERNSAQLAAQTNAQTANIAASRAQVDQQSASTQGSRAYVLRAPVSGTVTALVSRVGQPVSPQAPLMTIVPAGAVLQAQLAVPSAAIGFVKPGMTVRMAIDAFPYARFGTVEGKVLTVASSVIGQPGVNGGVQEVYPVTVALSQTAVTAYARREPLVSGMTLTARIVAERQSLLQWLFDPLFAIGKR